MKILHIFDHSVPLHSGYTFRSMSILKQQRKLGWETVHVTSPKQGKSGAPAGGAETVDGFVFHRTGALSGLSRMTPGLKETMVMARLREAIDRLVRQEAPDIIHAHSPVLNALPALSVGRQHNIPVVYEVRAFWEDAAANHGTSKEGGPRYRATRAVETFVLNRADHIVTICEGLKSDITARDIPAEKVTVVPNAVDAEQFAPIKERDASLAAELGLKDQPVIGFLGSFYAYEGLSLLVEAMPQIREAVPDAKLLLVGGGPQDAVLKAEVWAREIEDSVIMPGRVPHDQIARYYSLVDVLAFPRQPMRLTELVTPLKPLEAMAMEIPVVASDVGGHKELIRDGETGILFKAGDADALVAAVTGLLTAPAERRESLMQAGRKFVEEERTWEKSVARYEDVYGALTTNGDA